MSRSPLFSIVVPTRNRVEYVTDCIYSLLHQTFADFEVIVSDNSSSPEDAEATKNVVAPFLDDKRVAYVRPERPLPMTEHWNWAVSHARGTYIGIVTDRMALRLYTLAAVTAVIQTDPDADAISFGSCVAKSRDGRIFIPRVDGECTATSLKSSDTLSGFSRSRMGKNNPRFLNSFCSRDAIARIQKHYGTIFTGIAPDYAFLFRYLNLFDSYLHIFHPLLLVQGEERSNGKAFLTGRMNEDSSDFRRRMLEEQAEWLQFGPIPGDTSVLNNIILREYEIGKAEGRPGRFPAIDKTAFYETAVERAIELNRNGHLGTEARQVLSAYGRDNKLTLRTIPEAPGEISNVMRAAARRVKQLLPAAKGSEMSLSDGENLKQVLNADLASHERTQAIK